MWLMQRDFLYTWNPRRSKVVQIIRTLATTSKKLWHHGPCMNLEPVRMELHLGWSNVPPRHRWGNCLCLLLSVVEAATSFHVFLLGGSIPSDNVTTTSVALGCAVTPSQICYDLLVFGIKDARIEENASTVHLWLYIKFVWSCFWIAVTTTTPTKNDDMEPRELRWMEDDFRFQWGIFRFQRTIFVEVTALDHEKILLHSSLSWSSKIHTTTVIWEVQISCGLGHILNLDNRHSREIFSLDQFKTSRLSIESTLNFSTAPAVTHRWGRSAGETDTTTFCEVHYTEYMTAD